MVGLLVINDETRSWPYIYIYIYNSILTELILPGLPFPSKKDEKYIIIIIKLHELITVCRL